MGSTRTAPEQRVKTINRRYISALIRGTSCETPRRLLKLTTPTWSGAERARVARAQRQQFPSPTSPLTITAAPTGECFAKKFTAHRAELEATIAKASGGRPPVKLVTDHYESEIARKEKALASGKWRAAKKDSECHDVQKGIFVDPTENNYLHTTLVCANPKCKVHFKSADRKEYATDRKYAARARSAAKETKLKQEIRREAFKAMVGASAHAKTLTPADLRNFIGRRLIDRLDSDTARHVCQALLIPTPKERNYGGRDYGAGITKYLASLKDDQLGAFLIALTAAPTINGGSWESTSSRRQRSGSR